MLKAARRGVILFFLIFFIRVCAFSQGSAGGTGMQSVELLAGKSITFKAAAVNGNTYQWFKDGKPIPSATADTLKISEPGIYTVLAYSSANCSSVLSDEYRVFVNGSGGPGGPGSPPIVTTPKVNLQVIKKSEIKVTGINEPYEYLITVNNKGPQDATKVIIIDKFPEGLVLKDMIVPSMGLATYDSKTRTVTWKIDQLALSQTADLRFNVESTNPGLIKNTAIVAASEEELYPADNQSTDEKKINGLKVPNVFTPNADNVNDLFEIRGLNEYPENEISIINRWGNIIYEKKNYKNDWEANGMDEGTFFYILKVKSTTGTWHTYKGYTTLLRTRSR